MAERSPPGEMQSEYQAESAEFIEAAASELRSKGWNALGIIKGEDGSRPDEILAADDQMLWDDMCSI